ncbi:class I SAM-dependent methyltransferase [Mycobacterium sp. 050272]|uniref:class I SAM-dependent methyltransferase n=1 Tax=Mycobacterium sp. 050272 TaxID=3142488 RepID=UPI003190DC41
MMQSFALYRSAGHRFVEGWLEPEVLDFVRIFDSVQRRNDIGGGVAEIGVHHGRFFIGLRLLLSAEQRALAIDVFGDQHLNVDGSGEGDRDKFLTNTKRWASDSRLTVHQADSTSLDRDTVRELVGSPVRLFSVDGGHTQEIVLSDMKLAEGCLAAGGVVIADDVFNERWPGVSVGTLNYLEDGAGLAPFAIGFNKVFFTQPEYVPTFQQAIEHKCDKSVRVALEYSTYAGHKVGLLFRTPRTPRQLLRKNRAARMIYNRLKK